MAILTGDEVNKLIREQSANTIKIAVDELIDVYEDNWEYIIRDELKRQFTEKEYNKLKLNTSKEINLVKRVVNELSLIYKDEAIRKNILSETEKEGVIEIKSDDIYDEVMKHSSIDITMPAADTYTNLLNHVLIKPVVRKSKMDYDLLFFNNAEILVDENDWKRIIAVKYYIGLDLPKEYGEEAVAGDTATFKRDFNIKQTRHGTPQHQFTKAFLYTLEDSEIDGNKIVGGKIYTFVQRNDNEILVESETKDNPYKDKDGNTVLPFVLTYREYPVRRLINFTSGNDLLDANITFALNLTYLNNLRKYQSFKQGVITASHPDGLPETLDIGPSSWLKLWDREGGANATLLDLQADIRMFWDTMKEEAALVLAQYHIKPGNFELSAQPESGFSAMMSNMDKLEYRQSKLPFWRIFEKELYELTKIVWNADGDGRQIKDGVFKVDFAEIKFPEKASDEEKRFNFEKNNNAVTSIDLVMKKNPDLTEEGAKVEYQKNKAFNDSEQPIVNIRPIQQPGNKINPNNNGGENALQKEEGKKKKING